MSKIASRNPRILVFDSGVGGMSIAQEILCLHPACDLVYVSDNEAFPYGTKTPGFLLDRVKKVLTGVLAHTSPIDILVIACNTASTLTLPMVRSNFKQPVVGVVPAIKPAAESSVSKVIGLLATPGTIGRDYTKQLISDYAKHCEVIAVGSSALVELAEQKLRGHAIQQSDIRTAIQTLLQHPNFPKMDTLVLACTHFPLLKVEIARELMPSVALIDSGNAIARRVDNLLQQSSLTGANQPPTHQAFFTDAKLHLAPPLTAFTALGLTPITIANLAI